MKVLGSHGIYYFKHYTVDEKNPAPPDVYETLSRMRYLTFIQSTGVGYFPSTVWMLHLLSHYLQKKPFLRNVLPTSDKGRPIRGIIVFRCLLLPVLKCGRHSVVFFCVCSYPIGSMYGIYLPTFGYFGWFSWEMLANIPWMDPMDTLWIQKTHQKCGFIFEDQYQYTLAMYTEGS